MTTLAEFLLARIAEDEQIARLIERSSLGADGPTRTMRDVEAKRKIVEEHGANQHRVDPCDAHDPSGRTIPCDTLRFLAAVYADHPDYRDEWKP